jgi:hypothetical protein
MLMDSPFVQRVEAVPYIPRMTLVAVIATVAVRRAIRGGIRGG